MYQLLTMIVCFFMLTGCTPTYHFSLPDVKPANHKLNANLKEDLLKEVLHIPGVIQMRTLRGTY